MCLFSRCVERLSGTAEQTTKRILVVYSRMKNSESTCGGLNYSRYYEFHDFQFVLGRGRRRDIYIVDLVLKNISVPSKLCGTKKGHLIFVYSTLLVGFWWSPTVLWKNGLASG